MGATAAKYDEIEPTLTRGRETGGPPRLQATRRPESEGACKAANSRLMLVRLCAFCPFNIKNKVQHMVPPLLDHYLIITVPLSLLVSGC